jgi:glycine/D-amino acid oxidase-like deaminating enzyme
LHVNVVVVGAGIAGLTTAYLLKKAGRTVVVLEKDVVAGGVSGHTTGKVTAQHGLIYEKLTRRLGRAIAKQYAVANMKAMVLMKHIVDVENIECDWKQQDSYVYTNDNTRIAEFELEAKVALGYGLPASFEVQTDLPFDTRGAVKFEEQATFHVRKYLLALADLVAGDGSYVFERSKATMIREGASGRVKTPKGVVYADDIVVTTNVPTFPLFARLSYCLVEYPLQSYIVAGKASWEVNGMYISPDKGHYSILPVKNDDDELLLIGGEGHIPYTRINANERYERLAEYGQKHFGMERIDYRWSAYDYLGYDDMPLIGRLYPWSKHLLTATGFMKWGMTNGTVAAMVLADQILEKKNGLSVVFNPHRASAVMSIPKVIGERLGFVR